MKGMKKKLPIYMILILALTALAPLSAQAAWKSVQGGKIYTSAKKKAGYVTGWKTINGVKYYFDRSNGLMATGWKDIKVKGRVYRYYFGNDGAVRTGIQTIDAQLYCFSERGRLQSGFITVNGKRYYGEAKTGVLARNRWVDAQSGSYYFLGDGTMAVNQLVHGNWIGADGRSRGVSAGNRKGFVRIDRRLYYYNNYGRQVTGWLTTGGRTYYLMPDVKTGWFRTGGGVYHADESGAIAKNRWEGKKYLGTSGAMLTGWATIQGRRYFFQDDGDYATGKQTLDGKTYRFASTGQMLTNYWYTTSGGKKYYYGADGARVSGMVRIGGKYYYFAGKNSRMRVRWFSADGKRYYAHKKYGYLYQSQWFTKSGRRYYAMGDCRLATGAVVIAGRVYGFSDRGRMYHSGLQTIGTETYYFRKDGTAYQNKWKRLNGKYYYFNYQGRMARNTTVGGFRVGPDGARLPKMQDGWTTKNGERYYVSGGVYVTGLRTIGSDKYYFNSYGVMQTGIQEIGGKKYYFYPGGNMAVGITLAIGSKEYTINYSGVVTAERTITVSGSSRGANIARFALKYVGNRYVYGGTSLTNGADCSGFVQTVFKNFGISLLRVANDQMYGPTSYYASLGYKKAVVVGTNSMLPGDLVFYGSGNYASHVAIYIGGGQIVHASNSQPYPRGGIKISPYNYNTPLRVVRYWS